MNCFKLLILMIVLSCITCITSDAFSFNSFYINCGLPESTQTVSPFDDRVWRSDNDPAFAPSNLDIVSTNVSQDADDDLPFMIGRVFWSEVTYTFTVTPGPIFIRLYFFPNVSYNNTLPHQFSTSLIANNFTLLHNFNPFRNSPRTPLEYEFQIIIQKNSENNLNLTFFPGEVNDTKSSYGYVNGIEIQSIPKGLYINESNLNYSYVTDPVMSYTLPKESTAFQTACRLNVGGEKLYENDDGAGGKNRTWEADDAYLIGDYSGNKLDHPSAGTVNYTQKTPDYVAPDEVYWSVRDMGGYAGNAANYILTKNLTWMFSVDPGFDYVVRLHFCQWDSLVTGEKQNYMSVHIGGLLAVSDLDIWAEAGGLGIPVYKDYVTTVPGISNGSKFPLSLTIFPQTAYITDAFLNGLEILKLSDTTRNLAVPNPPYDGFHTTSSAKSPTRKIIIITGSVIAGLLLFSVILLALFRRTLRYKKLFTSPNSSRPSLPTDLCRRFSLTQIRVATRDFDHNLIIGRGGFGKVYKGCIDGGATDVAVKRLNPTSKQGEHEFLTEIEMLSRLRHKHLVSLIGYCDDKGEMILIYEYMPRGTLRDHFNYRDSKGTAKNEVLSWKQRLMICLGSARGLEYLHAGTKQLIIHRDVKSTNILLDDKWTAKVSDFGLSKVGPASDTGVGHVSTIVKGSFGYLDPEYYQRGHLTEKSDVYSFGVMLFEVMCSRPAVELNLPKVRACYAKGILYTLVDPTLTGQITPECLSKFGEIAELCIRANRDERPSMRDVVLSLEFMLTLQQTAENTGDISLMVDFTISSGGENGACTISFEEYICETRAVGVDTQGPTVASNAAVTNSHMEFKSGSVFSEIFDPRPR